MFNEIEFKNFKRLTSGISADKYLVLFYAASGD